MRRLPFPDAAAALSYCQQHISEQFEGNQLVEMMFTQIRHAVHSEELGTNFRTLISLRESLWRQEAFDLPMSPYEDIFAFIWDAKPGASLSLDHAAAWGEAIGRLPAPSLLSRRPNESRYQPKACRQLGNKVSPIRRLWPFCR